MVDDRILVDQMAARLVSVLRVCWPVVAGIVVFLAVGRYGFNPTDEGFVNGVAYRVLQGEIPHRDFIWGRPAGTAYLHAPELLLPFPMVMTSRVIALGQIIGYTLLLATLVTRRAPWEWRIGQVIVVISAVLVNVNTLPLMVWPTIDGILLVAGGAILIQRGLGRSDLMPIVLGFLLLGAATPMKQSFWPALFFGLVWLVVASPRPMLRQRVPAALLAAAVVPVAYASLVGLSGGMDEMLVQFGSVRPVVGLELFTELTNPLVTFLLAAIVGSTAFAPRSARVPWVARAIPPVVIALMVGGVLAVVGLELRGEWAAILWWFVLAQVAARLVRDRRWDWAGLVLVGLGWMASLSWGLAAPTLVGGSLGAYLLLRSIEDAEVTSDHGFGRIGATAAGVLLILCLPAFLGERLTHVYRDRPADQLTSSLDDVHPDFVGVLTNPVTASYLRQLVDCVEAYPADEVAILPDNPALYPILELDNPFPADWILPTDIVNSERRFIDAAANLDERGGYLVLIQPLSAHRLGAAESLARDPAGPFRDPVHGTQIIQKLTGTAIECGDFYGVWSP